MTDNQRIEEIKKYANLSANALSKEIGLKNPQIFYNTLFDNRLIILLSSFIFLLVGLYKTQNREKFI